MSSSTIRPAQSIASSQPESSRLFFLDLLKAISIVAVVSYHAIFVPRSTYADSELAIEVMSAPLRFCVPILLTISFLLMERGLTNPSKGTRWDLIRKRLTRLAIPTFFWFGVMAGLKLLTGNSIEDISGEMLKGTIFTGSYYLLIVLQLVPIFVVIRGAFASPRRVAMVVLAQALVFLGLYAALAGAFGTEIVSTLRASDRPLILYWFGYMALGAYLYHNLATVTRISSRIPMSLKLLTLLAVGLLFTIEYYWLARLTNLSIPPFDYVMLSCILCVPVIILAFASIQESQLPVPIRNTVHLLSKYCLGIFCINGVLSQVFLSIGSKVFNEAAFSFAEILAIKLLGWCFLLGASLALSLLLEKIRLKSVVC